MKHITTL